MSSQVTIARHAFFYKVFFNKHKDFLEELSKISAIQLNEGYKKLNVFYGSYSYYLKEDDHDTYLKDMMREQRQDLKTDIGFNEILNKIKVGGLTALSYDELIKFNLLQHKYFKQILEIFEIFCFRFAPSDIFPKITAQSQEYDLNLFYVVYDTFYESLFNLHAKIHVTLLDFNIVEFTEMFKFLMVFFYGYSYYLKKSTIKILKDKFNELYDYYNNKEFLQVYFNLVQGRVNEQGIKLLNEYKEKMFDDCMDIYELINSDLPKSNLFPKRAEKVTTDMTLI